MKEDMEKSGISDVRENWAVPKHPKPIVMIGAGGIVRDAHLPAYKKAGFQVRGVFDPDADRSRSLAQNWGIATVYQSLEEATGECGTDVVYDLATPPDVVAGTLEVLPEGAAVLVQKPMGSNLADARRIREISSARKLKAAVNFQLRFSPMMLAAADMIQKGLIGKLLEIDVQVNIFTPWHLFPFLAGIERMELSVHSIHYLDMMRALAGNPRGVFCRTMGDPRSSDYAQTRTSAILDYGPELRAIMNTNHNHRGGNDHQIARFRLEGSEGCLLVKLGVLYDYPKGQPDEVLFCPNDGAWQSLDLEGAWFPDAFIGTMSNVQRFDAGEDDHLVSSIADAFETMALVEACYDANLLDGVELDLS